MRKKLLIGTVVPLVAAVGLWFGLAGNATAHAPRTHRVSSKAAPAVVHRSKPATRSAPRARSKASTAEATATDGDNVQSGDQSAPDTAAGESGTETETTSPETDNVDCQQEGDFQGVNTGGTDPNCNGSGV